MNLTSDSATNIGLKAFLLGVVAPLAVLNLSLKSLRVIGLREAESMLSMLPLYRSDILLLLLFSLFGVGLLSGLRRQRNTTLLALQIVGLLWAIIETVAHQFYLATGSTIDFGLVLFTVQRLGDTGQVIASETPLLLMVLLLQIVLIMTLLPWYVLYRSVVADNPVQPQPRALLAAGSLFFISSAWSMLPVVNVNNPGFARSNLINFAFSVARLDEGLAGGEVTRQATEGLVIARTAAPSAPRNLVIVILESTRASATTPYNPDLATTPFFDSLKKRSLFAERAYAVVPHTSKALVAILCGIEPHLTMPVTEAEEGGIPASCLAELLAEAGYRSVFFQSATRQFEARDGLVANLGFDEFFPLEKLDQDNMERANYFSLEDAVMLSASRQWLEDQADQGPFLATYLTGTPHHDYQAPARRYGRRDFTADDELNRYLNSVWYVDQFSRELLEQYQSAGHYQDTLFVFVGDHGEAFNEHGRSQHDNIMWEEGLHVPLLIHDPAAPTGSVVSKPVSHLDLLPSLAELLGYTLEGAELPGELLWQKAGERSLFAHCWYQLNCMAVINGEHKYIEHFGRRNNEYYDLRQDPAESSNRHGQLSPEQVEQIRVELFSWRRAVNTLYRSQGD